MPPPFAPSYAGGTAHPRLTLIRPAKSPVNKLQRQLLRRSSAGPLLTYTLSAVFVCYIVIRAVDAGFLFSSGRGLLMPVDAGGAGAAAEQEVAELADTADTAWDAAHDDAGGLAWRLLVITVEAVYGVAAVAWSAMATGAFSWAQNWKYRCAWPSHSRLHADTGLM